MAWYNITELQHKYNNNTRIIFTGLDTIEINLLHTFWNYLGKGNITKLIYFVCQTIESRKTLISFGCYIEKSLFRCLIKNIIRKLQFSLPLQKSNSGTLSFHSIHFFEVFSCDEQLKKWRRHSVCSFVRSSFRSLFFFLVAFEFYLVLKSVNGVSRKFQGCFK